MPCQKLVCGNVFRGTTVNGNNTFRFPLHATIGLPTAVTVKPREPAFRPRMTTKSQYRTACVRQTQLHPRQRWGGKQRVY